MTGAERVRRVSDKKRTAGLRQIKIWVHPDEADRVRNYAANQPMTKFIIGNLS